MLYVIGLGLSDEKDITVRGLEASDPSFPALLPRPLAPRSPDPLQAVRGCSRVYLEYYTSILTVSIDRLVRRPLRTCPKPLIPTHDADTEICGDGDGPR
jgi:diphthine synthase